MSSRFVRRVRTASGAVAVQLVVKDRGEVIDVEHVCSAHSNAELALLLAAVQERLAARAAGAGVRRAGGRASPSR